jgi:uncharacterized RDD family membrane protein YckC
MNVPGSLAERGARLLAASIDELIVLGAFLPMLIGPVRLISSMIATSLTGELADTSNVVSDIVSSMLQGPGIIVTVIALLAWCVITAWLVTANGQSIGKRLVKIKVVRTDGSRASFGRIVLLRNFVSSLPGLLPYLGWIYLFADPLLIYQDSRRCIHDLIADTIVVRCVSKGSGST